MGGQRAELGDLRLRDLRCSAFIFSRSGQFIDCNNVAKANGLYKHGQTLEGLLGQLGFGATSSEPAFVECLARTGVWSSQGSSACLGAPPPAGSTCVYLLADGSEGTGDYLVLCPTQPATRCKASAPDVSSNGAAAEQRLREQLQTLQRKLLKTVAENEELGTRLAGLRSVCLELTEQLTDTDTTRPLDGGTRHHLLHLTSTAAAYCEMPAGAGSFGLGRHSSSGRLRDVVDLDEAVAAAAAAVGVVIGSGRGQSAAAAATGMPATAGCCGASCDAADAAEPDAGSGSGRGLPSGTTEGVSLPSTAAGPPGAAAAAVHSGGCSAADYTSLMESFMALKASYDVLLHQQDALLDAEAAALPSPSRPVAVPGPATVPGAAAAAAVAARPLQASGPEALTQHVQREEMQCRPISPNSSHRASVMSSAPTVTMHRGLMRRGSITGLMGMGMESGAGGPGAALSANSRLGSSNDDGSDHAAQDVNNLDGSTTDVPASAMRGATANSLSLLHQGLSSVASSGGVGELERLAAHARALKASCDVMQLQRDRAMHAATAQKATFDRALAVAQQEVEVVADSAAATKAQFDKFVLDKAEEKAAFDAVLEQTAAEASQQKAIADKALVDYGELQANATATKAQFDKFVLDKAEEKAAFDHVLEQTAAEASQQKAIADKALVDFGELQANATAAKAQFDKFVLDKAEEKAAFDHVLEQTAAEASQQKAIADKALVDYGELQANATATKAQFDKFVLDKAEEKAAFDHVLEQTAAEASQQKAIADKALVDYGELQANATATKAQFDKFVLDKAEEKATFDAVLQHAEAHAAQQKAMADKALVDYGELQANATATKAQFDKFVLDKAEEKAAFDHVLEQTAAEASQLKAIADKALVDYGELQANAAADKAVHDKALYDVQANATATKAQFDKFVLDKAEEKAVFDHVLEHAEAHAAQQKAMADKALVDYGELQANATATKAQFDKFVLDKAEEKAAFDHVLEQTAAEASQQKAIADKALVDYGELQANATATKAQFDKFVLDKAEEKATFDAVLEQTAAEASQQKAIADKALVDFGELQANAAADKAVHDKALNDVQANAASTKAQFDKFVLDKAEEKAAFDHVLERTAAEASQQKAIADKALVDFGELQATAATDKAAHDKALHDVQANATSTKAQFDKFVLDKAEEKAAFDQVLEQTAAEASQQKAIADKALVDYGELQANATADKAVHDKALFDVQANATATKAQFDKFVLDKAEEKAAFDHVLEQTAAEASQQKAIADKALVDYGELQANAAADKAVHDKALNDVQANAASTKAQFDKFVLDKAEEKATFDAVLEQTAAEASQQKAIADKALVDYGELQAVAVADKAVHDKSLFDVQQTADAAKAQFDKLVADTAEEKAAFDEALGRAAEEAAEHQRRADTMRAEAEATAARLASERQYLDNLQAQNERLLKQQEVLQAELAMALRSYTPRTIIDAGTPADKILAMMTDLLDGSPPTIQDILFVQSAILEAHDVYKPVNLGKQLLASSALDKDVGLSLLQQLGSQGEADEATRAANAASNGGGATGGSATEALTLRDFGTRGLSAPQQTAGLPASPSAGSCSSSLAGEAGRGAGGQAVVCWDTLESALTAIMALTSVPVEEGVMAEDAGGWGSRAGGCMDGAGFISSGGASGPLGAAAPGTPRAAALAAALQDGSGNNRLLMRAVSTASRSMHARARAGSVSASQLGACGAAGSVGSGPGGGGGLLGQAPLERTNTAASLATTMTELCELDEFPELPLYTEVERVLGGGAVSWQWDAFKLADASADHALSTLGYYLFHQSDLIRKFDLRPPQLAAFLRRVEEGYRANPYHSKTHAADVLQSLHVLIHRGGLAPGYVDPLSLMACYLAAIIHDFEHGGLTNDYLINSSDELALRYNDRAPLENHHCAAAFLLLRRPEYAFMAHLPKADTDRLRKMVIELVLATDMKQHFAIMSHFTTVHRLSAAASVTPSLMSGERRRSSSNASSVNSMACSGSGVEMDKILIPLDENERILSLQMALKCSDIGHVCASLPVHLRWVAALEEEFFRQGDLEKAHALPVSPLFDRAKPGITKSQVGFFDIVVIPLLSNFSRVFTNAKPLLTYTMRNYKYWSEAQKTEQQVAAAAAASGGR
ncbi:hypothetical protein HXX76_001757 [Chlamydomonas incerta]|uniref:Phosphodiesterase n=1 Tax=Chlamydomonas incerta TaxID=51695 RepID=A0A835W7H0_CHLIN|nr:hypothetical protein HXX76_001757 [Chlamydomonas incerta]|eukprot:KAG2443397.1 hypothetical protein HXX76_001757 [Chlamydomonas incerta]